MLALGKLYCLHSSLVEGETFYVSKMKAFADNKCWYSPFPKQHISDSSTLKGFAHDNFKFDENGRKFSKWVENTVGKGGIACYEQFLLFSQCFQKTSYADT